MMRPLLFPLLLSLVASGCDRPRVQVVGESQTADGSIHAFLWTDGEMIDLGTLGGTNSWATDINDRGQVVGSSQITDCCEAYIEFRSYPHDTHAFVWENGQLTDLGAFGSGQSWAMGINNRGQAVGASPDSSGDYRAVLWEAGGMQDLRAVGCGGVAWAINDRGHSVGSSLCVDGESTDLGTLGGDEMLAKDINERGQVIGETWTATGEQRAFLWQDGSMTDLGTLCSAGDCESVANAINDHGQVVGYSDIDPSSGITRAFLWDNGAMRELGTLGGEESEARDINNCGQVVGVSLTATGERHAFLWDDGEMTDLGTLGGRNSGATAISDCGEAEDSDDAYG